jgi:hypothetical protein
MKKSRSMQRQIAKKQNLIMDLKRREEGNYLVLNLCYQELLDLALTQ